MKVAILGTRGIPNNYGGFEQLAESLSTGLVRRGHTVYVYNSHNHYYKQKTWNQVNIIHCYDPEYLLGSAGQFVYDLNCILDARKRNFDIILILGYTSSSIWGPLYPKNSAILFNMDGLEWKRSKYSLPVKKFLQYAEKLAVKYSDHIIADSRVIQTYLENKFNLDPRYIAYGAEMFNNERETILNSYDISKFNYYVSMGRMVPENNMEMILDGFTASSSEKKFLVIGNTANKFGGYLTGKFRKDERIRFIGAVYETEKKHTLKYFSHLYFHGHSAGGTNPCLLEAMASQSLIAANENAFNRNILMDDAYYFSSAEDVRQMIESTGRGFQEMTMIKNNLQKIREQFCWEKIIEQYESLMLQYCNQKGR